MAGVDEALKSIAPCADDPLHQRLGKAAAIYCVGGAVRDVLLGAMADPTHSTAHSPTHSPAEHDRDYLVVGSSPEAMVAAGFRPVGKDFPVFLHPQTHDEYALARTERKSGRGYHGFVFLAGPEVTLEEDLQRRDLTINAMAVDVEGRLHDPRGGLHDLRAGLLRHVSPAFQEDPVRLLRLARFAARWPRFSVAAETEALGQRMVAEGEAEALVGERVWQELARGLMAAKPSRMVGLLVSLGAWGPATRGLQPPSARILEEVDGLATQATEVGIRAGLLFSESPPPLGLPGLPREVHDWHRLLQPAQRERAMADGNGRWDSNALLAWMSEADLFRRAERLMPLGSLHRPPLPEALCRALQAIAERPMGDVAQAASRLGQPVPEAIRARRLALIDDALPRSGTSA